jgi:hypothetical protein
MRALPNEALVRTKTPFSRKLEQGNFTGCSANPQADSRFAQGIYHSYIQ